MREGGRVAIHRSILGAWSQKLCAGAMRCLGFSTLSLGSTLRLSNMAQLL